MVKKREPQRIWQQEQESSDHSSLQQNIQIELSQNDEDSYKRQEQKQYLKHTLYQSHQKSQSHQIKQQSQKQQEQKNDEQGFKITTNLINELNEQIYKTIVLPELIQTNDSYHTLEESVLEQQNLQSKNCKKVKEYERQKILQFIFQQSLRVPIYYQQFYTNKKLTHQKQLYPKQACRIAPQQKMKKRQFLLYANSVLLDLTNIKFLNIYGPTGSGKTYMLKSIFKSQKIQSNIIWINGMNIIKGKTKRFLSDIQNKLNSLFEDIYSENNSMPSNTQISIGFAGGFHTKNEKILILDEYDQVAHFNMTDLLIYAYVKSLKTQRKSQPQKKIQFFSITKVILVSNTFSTQINQHEIQQNTYKMLYIENLVFRPFCETQAVQILKQKIQKINQKFRIFLSKSNLLKSLFQQNPLGVFTEQKLLHLIKKICFGDQVDIRKILFFYCDSIKKFIELLQQKLQKRSGKPIKKQKDYLIDDNFLFGALNNKAEIIEIENLLKNTAHCYQIEDLENPVVFYIANLENEGKNILKAIHKEATIQRKNIKEQQEKDEKNNNFKNTEKTSLQKKKQNIIKVEDFYIKIRPRLSYHKIFHWIYEWQQLGLLKIKKDISSFSISESANKKSSEKIKILDNYQIQILDRQLIEKGLEIY